MKGGEEPEEIGDEHLDGVKELATQVVSQLQAAFEGKEHAFTAGDIELTEVASQEELGLPEEGLVTAYSFTRGSEEAQYLVTHAVAGELLPEEVEETAAEEALEEGAAEDVAAEETEAGEAEAGEAAEAEGAEAEGAGEEDVATDTDTAVAEEVSEEDQELAEDIASELPSEGDEDLAGVTDIDSLFGDEADEGGVVEISRADFDELADTGPGNGKERKISLLLDVELDVTVELGRKIMLVEEILRLGKGSVVELNKLAGEPVDILVNGKKLAEGEVVVVEDHFGVRLTHLLEPKERIKSLG
ncbi:MAG: flagellar motor switch protein FliN [Fidelibacterota bacterium]|nr:MAG: flagellar motor switch protein FliN [Candidatus Neomarinimicrobiota bacterium]